MNLIAIKDMVLVPAGDFISGLTVQDIARIAKGYVSYHSETLERAACPQQEIYVDTFYIGTYPVTNREFEEFVDATGYTTLYERIGGPIPTWRTYYQPGRQNHPVVCVSRDDALAYCKWINHVKGCKVRLPSRHEWEKAARGTDGRLYPWGNVFDLDKCNTHESHQMPPAQATSWSLPSDDYLRAVSAEYAAVGQPLPQVYRKENIAQMARNGMHLWTTTPVDAYPNGISPYGCFDMCGNVREWVADSWQPVTAKHVLLGVNAICCGGGWSCSAPLCCPAFYTPFASDVGLASMGFRVAANQK